MKEFLFFFMETVTVTAKPLFFLKDLFLKQLNKKMKKKVEIKVFEKQVFICLILYIYLKI